MFSVFSNVTYRRLFLAQAVALVGTGTLTVALGLLAFELAGPQAGTVLGTALAIKMIAYVGVAPIASAFTGLVPTRTLLVSLDLVRAAIALSLPFVSEIWQIYILIFLLQAASAAFTPTFQATIPSVLPSEREYTIALSLSRLAYDIESVVSPVVAGILLTFVSFHSLFVGTVVGFVASAALVLSVTLPALNFRPTGSVYHRTTRGLKIYFQVPELRALLAINFGVAASGAVVIVNTVVYVQSLFGMDQSATAVALAFSGGGSMLAALMLPRLLQYLSDRSVMLTGIAVISGITFACSLIGSYSVLLVLWFCLGFLRSITMTPSGRLLKNAAAEEDRAYLFAAQFTLSHACWLVTYPLAGWGGATLGLGPTALVMAGLTTLSVGLAFHLWSRKAAPVTHHHRDLPAEHPHIRESGSVHSHKRVLDHLHPATLWQT
ncbi:MFS transporter [Devosia yakushimensis]|uniref:MFS transporter n=1 Tax=Devosia yakushimensis TaxID=470028 RepID=UPI0024E12051|nr:MFS transporter [Devosia yakushimensis]